MNTETQVDLMEIINIDTYLLELAEAKYPDNIDVTSDDFSHLDRERVSHALYRLHYEGKIKALTTDSNGSISCYTAS